ncbi:hypothetical protein FDUTEX481_05462 [Tolypothrix sp. PCC 7601]|nr:hypothetical protein FDUTEX481_05462 [Tolypothrix sp. PCC 7601]
MFRFFKNWRDAINRVCTQGSRGKGQGLKVKGQKLFLLLSLSPSFPSPHYPLSPEGAPSSPIPSTQSPLPLTRTD